VILVFVVLMLGVFCCAEIGDEWDSFGGNDSGDFSVGANIKNESSDMSVVSGNGVEKNYTLEFYVALGIGVVGFLIIAVFVYFFLRKPKNKWERKAIK